MRGTWDRRRVTAIAVGGAAGAVLRWAVVTSIEAGQFPWPVFALNIAGSVFLGVLLAEEWSHPSARLAATRRWRDRLLRWAHDVLDVLA